MTNGAWNRVLQIHPEFKKIIAPLKENLGIDFGYMIVFNDGSYFQIIENLECLQKWVTNVETSHIFCARNVTTYFDAVYNFTIWPKVPTSLAMEIYKDYSIWNGITVSKINKDYTELYWFTKKQEEEDYHKFFIRNKALLIEFINYFNRCKNILHFLERHCDKDLFSFKYGFDLKIIDSIYIQNDHHKLAKTSKLINSAFSEQQLSVKTKLSSREIQVLDMICRGYTYKEAGRKLAISPKTIHYHIEHIKSKTGIRSKLELIEFYEALKNWKF